MTTIRLDPSPHTSFALPLLAGAAVAFTLFAGLGGWAATAPLAGAVVAPAIVAPDGSRKTMQHLEGGIVRRILVQDGSRIEAGQPLLELDATHARAEHEALRAEWRALTASETRLLAEQTGRAQLVFPADLVAAAQDNAALARLLASEDERLASRRAARRDQQAVLVERITQAAAEIDGHEARITSGRHQLDLIDEELRAVKELFAKGLERKPRLLALERARAQLEGAIGADRAAVARAGQVIAETRQRMRGLESEYAETVAAELAAVRKDLASLAEKLPATADRLARTVVTAPVAGTVVGLRIKTTGGVVNPGEPLLDLVPADADLLLETRIAPVDIDEVHEGLRAQIHLLAYRSRHLPRIEGTVRAVSADRLEDPHTGQPYYLARVAVERSALPAGISLAPGMPADVMIVTGERTLLEYLTQPITDTLRRGLRES